MTAGDTSLTRWLTPADNRKARLRVEELCAVARNCRLLLLDPLFVILLVLLDVQWVPLSRIAPWAALVLLALVPAVGGSHYLFRHPPKPEDAGRLTLAMMALVLPLNLIWLSMVLFAWVDGNFLNNAFLMSFVFGSVAVGIAVFGPSRHVAIPGLLFALGLFATHPIQVGTPMDWLSVPLQTLSGLTLFALAHVFHGIFRGAVVQRLEKEDLAADLARTAAALERARDEALNANQAKSTFLANMSHELRTPLNAIIGFTDMMQQRIWGPMAPRYGEYVEDVHRSGKHLLALINDILDLAKIEAGRLELDEREIGLQALATQAGELVRPQAQRADVDVRAAIATDRMLLGDERALLQILVNLLSNAVKFSRPGGHATIFARDENGGLVLGVEDDGIGMDEDDLKKAMEPFGQAVASVTVEGRGTGLGLPLVKALIEAHGAGFRIESASGIGTKVWGEFPAARLRERRAVA